METPPPHDIQRAVGDRYEVLALVAAGGMGAVFRARHRALGHLVAIKVLPPEIAASEMRQARFKREAALAASLSHPNIVPVYEFDTREGITFLIMPFVRGRTLQELREEQGRMDLATVRRVLQEVGAALDFAHERGIVHRDVKPSNILIEEGTNRALLADFGIARVDEVATSSLTAPGTPIGTPAYMAPEQMAGSADLDGRADLYSLALVGFEALTGKRPMFLETDLASLARTLRAAQPQLTAAQAAALVAPLAVAPDDRPRTALGWLLPLERGAAQRRPRWAVAGATLALLGGVGLAIKFCGPPVPPPPALAVMPFTVLGTPPYPPTQLPTYFISRFSPVPGLAEVVSFGKLVAQTGTDPVSNGEAEEVARRLQAKYFLQGSVAFTDGTVALTATLYEVGKRKPRRSGTASGPVGAVSDVMDRVWAKILPDFAPNAYGTIPRGKDAIAAFFNAEDAFRRGDYRSAQDGYRRVTEADSEFAMAHLRLALVAAQVDPSEAGFGTALAGAWRHQSGLSPVDSLLLEGFRLLVQRGDGWEAADRFKRATERASDYVLAWLVQGEFVYHFGNLFDQPLVEAQNAFGRVLDLDRRFAPAISHLISLTYVLGDKPATQRLIKEYLNTDSTSVVAEVVGIADTLVFGTLIDRGNLLKHVDQHSFTALEFLAFQAAQSGTEEQRLGSARRVLRALERRAATDAERATALRMGVAADLRAGWSDSARARLARVTGAWGGRERDVWLVLAQATGLPNLGDWRAAADRIAVGLQTTRAPDPVAHWLLSATGIGRADHTAALRRLAADSTPLAGSLSLDLAAREALAQHDTAKALSLWDRATHRYAVLRVPLDQVASLWPLRLAVVRVATAAADSARASKTCATFNALIGYVDQVAFPEIERSCARWRVQGR
jgi:serine/threonine protein kinase/tetratricopeptide (TPR) repeat protein